MDPSKDIKLSLFSGVVSVAFVFCFILLISIDRSTERVANLIKVLRPGMFGM